MSIIDETMSQDPAFTTDNEKDTFKFDEVVETSPDSQPNEENKETEGNDSVVAEDNQNEPEEDQKVPYSRFKKVVDERNETASKIQFLEERLQELENNRQESTPEDTEMPSEWVELYGNNEVAKRAWAVQQRREDEIAERAISQAVERLRKQQEDEINAVAENEETIDNNLFELQERIGKKLSSKQEEEILTIVDEFSPVGDDGKYITVFPFDKAYEIYALRQSQKGLGTRQARQAVADLAGNQSEGEADPQEPNFKRGWDNWREAL